VSDLGRTLREARQQARLSLSGMAVRTGYSRSYLGNIETGIRPVTPDVIKKYELVLGDDVNRRNLLLGSIAALAAPSVPEAAVSIAHDISAGRTTMLTEEQTTHATDTAVAALVARNGGSVASLVKWSRTGKALLRVNAAGILAKVRSPTLENEAVAAIQADSEARTLYLTAVIYRVLGLTWDQASDLAQSRGLLSPLQVGAVATELANSADAGARFCSALLLARDANDPSIQTALRTALRAEQSRENLRTIGAVLAGFNPLNI
jgi:transcriptional regulator with XRE-family HTH domain